jgi:hypothetical protein
VRSGRRERLEILLIILGQIETFVSLSQGLHDLDARVDPFTPLDIGGNHGQPV